MLQIQKKHAVKIRELMKLIENNSIVHDKMFNGICVEMNIDPETAEGDILFDHIFNGTRWQVKYVDN